MFDFGRWIDSGFVTAKTSFALKLRRRAENDALSVTFVMISRLPDDILIGKLLSLIANKKK